jgi:phospholipase C
MFSILAALALLGAILGSLDLNPAEAFPPVPFEVAQTPIQHVVLLFQENHAFDNVLGRLCVADGRCEGVTKGKTHDGKTIDLKPADDVVPNPSHTRQAQLKAINDGQMNGWDTIKGCSRSGGYQCYQAYTPSQIPNLASLAREFVISDRTFGDELVPSWGSHLFLLTAQLDGFSGDIPKPAKNWPQKPGWGCDSNHVTTWQATPSDPLQKNIPSCVPDQTGLGPFKPSPVQWVPSIFDRLDEAGLSWRTYQAQPGDRGYHWAGCTYLAECIYGSQNVNIRDTFQIMDDANNGTLPAFSLVIPSGKVSQHNQMSMKVGDDLIGQLATALGQGPQWASTVLFIMYDDCGCFYDHVPPPNGWTIRTPMVIVSPYARAGYTDSTPASYASVLAFMEHTWALPPLTDADANAYDFANSFDFTQLPLPMPAMVRERISKSEREWIAAHPFDEDDPT